MCADSETFDGYFNKYQNCGIILSEAAIVAFHKIKSILSHVVKLSPIVSNKYLCLAVDASSIGVVSVLEQIVDGQWKPIIFFF